MRTFRRFLSLLIVVFVVFAGVAHAVTGDSDNDGVPDSTDNCPGVYNPTQADFNHDGVGDACQDTDKDGLTDAYELDSSHTYAQGQTDPTKADTDGDGLTDGYEVTHNYGTASNPQYSDPTLRDTDGDGWEDGTEAYVGTNPTLKDTDGDGVKDPTDNCPKTYNPDQKDSDHNGAGDACDPPPPPPCDVNCQAQQTVDSTTQTVQDTADSVIQQLPHLDTRAGADLDRMATDGYSVQIEQLSTGWRVGVFDSVGNPVALNLPDTGGLYQINAAVGAFMYNPTVNPTTATVSPQYPTEQGSRVNLKWKYSKRTKLVTIVLLTQHKSYTSPIVFQVPPVGYPTACGTTTPLIQSDCDGYAVGFYNPAKLIHPLDALDAVPYQVTFAS
jgi:hypothetical protein